MAVRAMAELNHRIDAFADPLAGHVDKGAVGHFGQVTCVAELRLRMVPFYEPCLIFVLSGTKHLGADTVASGGCLAVPAPSSHHMANQPDSVSGLYKALVVAFDAADIKHVRDILGVPTIRKPDGDIVTYDFDAATHAALMHYLDLDAGDSAARIAHRKREVLLVLAERNPDLLSFAVSGTGWVQRLRAVLDTDPSAAWTIEDACRQLAVTESTLRRHLRREGSGFREVLAEFRLSNALMGLLMSDAPVYAVALDNGYQSMSRFSENFKKRFGLTPSQVRERLPECG